jgi:hypothetical protein
MFPTSSRTFLVGKNALSATALITARLPPLPRAESQCARRPVKAYALESRDAKLEPAQATGIESGMFLAPCLGGE